MEQNDIKAFFFLRHNNDVDHIAPVLYKWLSTANIQTDIIITTKKSLLEDARINYLKQFKNASIFHLNELVKDQYLSNFFFNKYFKYGPKYDKLVKSNFFIKKISKKAITAVTEKLFGNISQGIVVFDWNTTHFTTEVIRKAKEKNLVCISLPHGDSPYINELTTNDDMLDVHKKIANTTFDVFDYVVLASKLFYKAYERGIGKNKIKVLGSARYSDEWLEILSKIQQHKKIEYGKNKIKIVLFLRNVYYPIFWDEVVRTVSMISQFKDIFLIVKHHPRGKEMINKFRKIDKLSNVLHVFSEIDSDRLLEWADYIFDIGTSVVWEPIKKGKPIIALEYLHANYSTPAYYIKNTGVYYRDQLVEFLKKVSKGKIKNFYNESERDNFIKEVIDYPDKKILERYVKFLKECLEESKKKK